MRDVDVDMRWNKGMVERMLELNEPQRCGGCSTGLEEGGVGIGFEDTEEQSTANRRLLAFHPFRLGSRLRPTTDGFLERLIFLDWRERVIVCLLFGFHILYTCYRSCHLGRGTLKD